MMQTRKNIIVNTCNVCKLENAKFTVENITFHLWKSVQKIKNSS